jgi:hypothetical protein
MRITVDGVEHAVPPGPIQVARLKERVGADPTRQLAISIGTVERSLADEDSIDLTPEAAFVTIEALRYRQHVKHKRVPAPGRKGTLCPTGVDAQGLLSRSDRDESAPRKRWAWSAGCAYCAHYDNVDAWHGFPVRLTDVPASIWQLWLEEGRITRPDLRRNAVCEG